MANWLSILPSDVVLEITTFLPLISLSRFLRTCKALWNHKHHSLTKRLEDSKKLFLVDGSLEKAFRHAITLHDPELVDYILSITTPNKKVFKYGFTLATTLGYKDLVEKFLGHLEEEEIESYSFYHAALHGQFHIIDYFYERNVESLRKASQFCIRGYAEGGFLERAIEWFKTNESFQDELDELAWLAARGGHADVVKLLLDKGVNPQKAVLGAIRGGNEEIFDTYAHLIDSEKVWNEFVSEACISGKSVKIVEYVLQHASPKTLDIDFYMHQAARNSRREMVYWCAKHGATNFGHGLGCAILAEDRELIEFMLEKGACNWNYAMSAAVELGDIEQIQYYIEKGADDWNLGLKTAACHVRFGLVDFFAEKGATAWQGALHHAYAFLDLELFRKGKGRAEMNAYLKKKGNIVDEPEEEEEDEDED